MAATARNPRCRPTLDCPLLRRRRRASGRAARTRRRRGGGRLPPRLDATAPRSRQPPAARAARPGRTGLPACCGAGKAGRRPCASPCVAAQTKPVKLGLHLNNGKNSMFAVGGLLRGGGHALTGRSTALAAAPMLTCAVVSSKDSPQRDARTRPERTKNNWVAHKNGG